METIEITCAVRLSLRLVDIRGVEHIVTEQSESIFHGIGADGQGAPERVEIRVVEGNTGGYAVRIAGEKSSPVEGISSDNLRSALLKAALEWERRNGVDAEDHSTVLSKPKTTQLKESPAEASPSA